MKNHWIIKATILLIFAVYLPLSVAQEKANFYNIENIQVTGSTSIPILFFPELQNLIDLVLGKDNQIKSADAAAKAAAMELDIAVRQLGPKASVQFVRSENLTKSRYEGNDINDGFDTSATVQASTTSLNIAMPLFNKQILEDISIAEKQWHASTINKKNVAFDVLRKIYTSYFNFSLLLDKRTEQKKALENNIKTLNYASKAMDHGDGTIIDVQDIKSQVQIASSELLEIEYQIQKASSDLEAATEQSNMKLTGISISEFESLLQISESNLPILQEISTPSISYAESLVAVADKQLAKADAAHYPVYELSLNHTMTSNYGNDINISSLPNSSINGSLNLQVTIPIFSSGAMRSTSKQALYNRQQREFEREQAIFDAKREYRENYFKVSTGPAKIKAYKAALDASILANLAIRKGFQVGNRTIMDVLKSDQQITTTSYELSRVNHEYALAILMLQFFTNNPAYPAIMDISYLH